MLYARVCFCESCSSTLVPLKELTLQRTGLRHEDARKLELLLWSAWGASCKKEVNFKNSRSKSRFTFLIVFQTSLKFPNSNQSREAIRTIGQIGLKIQYLKIFGFTDFTIDSNWIKRKVILASLITLQIWIGLDDVRAIMPWSISAVIIVLLASTC